MSQPFITANKLKTSILRLPASKSTHFFSHCPRSFHSTAATRHQNADHQVGSRPNQPQPLGNSRNTNIVYLGLGSNLGNRLKNISRAIDSLCASTQDQRTHSVQLLDSSFVYESQPMYLSNQPEFLNAVCKVSTSLSPHELLKIIKQIEAEHGRKLDNVPRNSPRPIDIDILIFNSDVVDDANLSIPHIGMLERRFVLQPLTDVAKRVIHPIKKISIASLLSDLDQSSQSTIRKTQLITADGCPTLDLTMRTHLMSIVNCTPDSFSDGGRSYLLEDAISNCLEHVSAGADILDIGGMSTRPGAEEVPVQEEINRTVPLIRALREHHGVDCHISIDTFRATTARAAINAGATIVNDVSGGQADRDMHKTVAQLDVPYVMMHTRGNSRTMDTLSSYLDSDVVRGVQRELSDSVQSALRSGIKRWNIIIDPGFGFAKDSVGNCQLLNDLDQLQQHLLPIATHDDRNGPEASDDNPLHGFPLLVGLSRKKFLGQLLVWNKRDNHHSMEIPAPNARLVPTIAASAMAIMKGAQVIRAHDTRTMKQVIGTVDGIRSLGRR